MSIQVSYKKQFIFGFMLLLIVLAVVEGIVRIYEFQSIRCVLANSELLENKNELANQVCKDLWTTTYDYGDDYHTFVPNQHYSTLNINEFGFRGETITLEKPDNTFRMFLVGGSTAASLGATSDEFTISGFLQKELDSKNFPFKIEVINAGVGGSFSYEETRYVMDYLVKFSPDLILAYNGANDARYLVLEDGPNYDKHSQLGSIDLSDFTFYRTPFVLYSEFLRLNIIEKNDDEFKHSEKIAEIWKSRWIETCTFGKNNNFNTIIALQPILVIGNKSLTPFEQTIFETTNNKELTQEIFQLMSEYSSEINQHCDGMIDLRNTYDDISDPIYFDDVHVSDRGNKIIAKELYQNILSEVLDVPQP